MSPPTAAEIAALVDAARAIRGRAYAPYSKYHVGAALLAEDGSIHPGVNVENSAYPTGVCAERTALGAAVTAGATRFRAVAVVTEPPPGDEPAAPCGNCRQGLAEFGIDMTVILAGPSGEPIVTTLKELLPRAFTKQDLR